MPLSDGASVQPTGTEVKIEGTVEVGSQVVMWREGSSRMCGWHWYAVDFNILTGGRVLPVDVSYLNDSCSSQGGRVVPSGRPDGSYEGSNRISLIGLVVASGTALSFEAHHAAPSAQGFLEEVTKLGVRMVQVGLLPIPMLAIPIWLMLRRERSHRQNEESFRASLSRPFPISPAQER